jgi:hypothetical protein
VQDAGAAGVAERGDRAVLGVEHVAPMDEGDTRRRRGRAMRDLVAQARGERERLLGGAGDDDVPAGERLGRHALGMVEQLAALEGVEAGDLQRARHEGADARGQDDGAAVELQAGLRAHVEAAVVAARDVAHQLVEVEGGGERPDLFEQPLGELAPRAGGHCGDVVDRLVAVQLDALAARERQGVDDVGGDLAQPQLEHLEQARGACADDQGVGLDGRGHRGGARRATIT